MTRFLSVLIVAGSPLASSCGSAATPKAEITSSANAAESVPNTVTAGTNAQQPAEPVAITLGQLPGEVQAWARDKRAECAAEGSPVTGERFAPVVADLNGDSRPDYALSASDTFECDAGFMLWTAGQVPSLDVFLSSGRGYRHIEAPHSLDVAVGAFEGRPVLMLSTGGPGAWERPYDTYAYGWNGRELDVLAFFAGDRRVNEDGTRLDGGGWERAPFPESLTPGFYADSCWPPDPQGMNYVYLTERLWREWDGPSPISRVERNGPVRFRFHISVEDEAGNRSPSVIDIETRRLGELAVLHEGEESRFLSRCEDREVPAQVRRDMGGR